MIEVHVGFENNNPDLNETIRVKFPFLPRIGETLYLNERSLYALIRKVCSSTLLCSTHRGFQKGIEQVTYLNFDDAVIVKRIDWIQDELGEMGCVILIGNKHDSNKEKLNWDAETILKNTMEYYGLK
jgi:hypothetical protein